MDAAWSARSMEPSVTRDTPDRLARSSWLTCRSTRWALMRRPTRSRYGSRSAVVVRTCVRMAAPVESRQSRWPYELASARQQYEPVVLGEVRVVLDVAGRQRESV